MSSRSHSGSSRNIRRSISSHRAPRVKSRGRSKTRKFTNTSQTTSSPANGSFRRSSLSTSMSEPLADKTRFCPKLDTTGEYSIEIKRCNCPHLKQELSTFLHKYSTNENFEAFTFNLGTTPFVAVNMWNGPTGVFEQQRGAPPRYDPNLVEPSFDCSLRNAPANQSRSRSRSRSKSRVRDSLLPGPSRKRSTDQGQKEEAEVPHRKVRKQSNTSQSSASVQHVQVAQNSLAGRVYVVDDSGALQPIGRTNQRVVAEPASGGFRVLEMSPGPVEDVGLIGIEYTPNEPPTVDRLQALQAMREPALRIRLPNEQNAPQVPRPAPNLGYRRVNNNH